MTGKRKDFVRLLLKFWEFMFTGYIKGRAGKRKMEDFWTIFCGAAVNHTSSKGNFSCVDLLLSFALPSSCINHALIISFDVLLLIAFLAILFSRAGSKSNLTSALARGTSTTKLQLISAFFNGFLGVLYLSMGIWMLVKELQETGSILPLHWWLFLIFHGATWLSVGLVVSLRRNVFPQGPLRFLSVLAVLFAGITCGSSLVTAIVSKDVSFRIGLDILSLVGTCLLLVCTYKGYEDSRNNQSDLYAPLNGSANGNGKLEAVGSVTPLSKAKIFSKMSFWWLNPLMKRGREKTLDDEDIPKLCEEDQAESCYMMFVEKFNKQKRGDSLAQPSVLKTIMLCHWKEILLSGFFALLKIITLSCGPLLLNQFIEVAEGKGSFRFEGYILAIMLFFAKALESLSQRQWYFRCRLIGMKVRSLLTAAIYKKQLRLSNAAKLMHSSGEIMNYATVDAYRIGEFPYWFHQLWTTSLQLCFALAILFHAVGLATFASLVVILLTVICNAPLAKLQHSFQSKLMMAQDDRLKAISEALVNMKILKLYAWENHFKNVIEKLRAVEEKWLSAVQLRKAYNSFLFWSSPVLVSAATFGACYFLGVPLYASNVFTFVATLRLVQDPIRTIPDVIGVFIQAKVSFERIVKFLEAPELETGNVREKHYQQNGRHDIYIRSASLSWEDNPSKPTLRNICLEVRSGEKVAICGEVGSGKSTFLAAILGEVPVVQGTVSSNQSSTRF